MNLRMIRKHNNITKIYVSASEDSCRLSYVIIFKRLLNKKEPSRKCLLADYEAMNKRIRRHGCFFFYILTILPLFLTTNQTSRRNFCGVSFQILCYSSQKSGVVELFVPPQTVCKEGSITTTVIAHIDRNNTKVDKRLLFLVAEYSCCVYIAAYCMSTDCHYYFML